VPLSELLPADSPRIDGEDADHVRALAELDGPLPPVIVHRPTMRVIDGMHRVQSAMLRGDSLIRAEFFDGTPEEAFVRAVQMNSAHGLPLSQADRSAAARRILNSFPQWSNSVIASVVGLSDKTIAALRERATSETPGSHARIGNDGRVRPINPVNGRLRAGEFIEKNPDASLREIAKAAGIAVGTARDVRQRLRDGQDPFPRRLRSDDDDAGRNRMSASGSAMDEAEAPAPVIPAPREDLMATLRNDPSLRLTESGRMILRLLDAHILDESHWERLVGSVPTHCTQLVVDVARRCISSWSLFVERLEDRAVQ
jgi:hypothetical protein